MQSPSLLPQAQVLNSLELGFCCILVHSGVWKDTGISSAAFMVKLSVNKSCYYGILLAKHFNETEK